MTNAELEQIAEERTGCDGSLGDYENWTNYQKLREEMLGLKGMPYRLVKKSNPENSAVEPQKQNPLGEKKIEIYPIPGSLRDWLE